MAKSAPCVSAPSGLRMYENASLADLALPAGIVLVAATLARMIAMRLVLEPLAVWAVGEGSNVEFTRTKFVQAAWRTILYATACTLAVKVMFLTEELPWIYDSSLFWIDWPNHELTEGMASVYALYAGFYVHQLVYLFLDVKTSDFVALLVHHIITLGLVVSSFVMKFTRVGLFVMLLHDVSDVFLESAKCFNYMKDGPRHWLHKGADVCFVVFAISFFSLRLYIYPVRVLWPVASPDGVCQYATCASTELGGATWDHCAVKPAYTAFTGLLGGLQLLQVFWGWKVLMVVWTILSGKELEDPRDDASEEDSKRRSSRELDPSSRRSEED